MVKLYRIRLKTYERVEYVGSFRIEGSFIRFWAEKKFQDKSTFWQDELYQEVPLDHKEFVVPVEQVGHVVDES